MNKASFTSAVAQVSGFLENFSTKAIIKIETEPELILAELKQSSIKERVIYVFEIKKISEI